MSQPAPCCLPYTQVSTLTSSIFIRPQFSKVFFKVFLYKDRETSPYVHSASPGLSMTSRGSVLRLKFMFIYKVTSRRLFLLLLLLVNHPSPPPPLTDPLLTSRFRSCKRVIFSLRLHIRDSTPFILPFLHLLPVLTFPPQAETVTRKGRAVR